MPPEAGEQILRVLERHRRERHLIALQDYPDPDAISSAMAHQRLSRAFDIHTAIVYAGEVSHHQNRKLVDALKVDLHHLRDGLEAADWDGAAFVDNQGTTCAYLARVLARSAIPTVLVVDHHEAETRLQPEASVVEAVGATATIYAELYRDSRLPVEPTSPEGRLLASGLLYGILTDTQQLATASPRDRRAAAWLTSYSDTDLLREVAQQPVPNESLEILSRAEATRVVRRGFAFAGVGYLPAIHRDSLPQAATWLLGQGGAHTAVVFGIVRDWRYLETVAGSLRTVLPTPTPHDFLQEALGSRVDGEVLSGGRAFSGGFEIPVGMSTRGSSIESQMVRWAYYEHLLLARFLQAAEANAHQVGDEPPEAVALDSVPQFPDAFDRQSPVWSVLSRYERGRATRR